MANSVFIAPGLGGGGGISPTNPSLFPNGSAAAPSISFINDPQSGRYLIGVDNVGESINGSLVFDWNATRLRTSLPIYLPNGAVGTPALAFENDATSGRYRIGNDNFGESVNGVLAFDWNATRLLSALNIQLGAANTLGWSDVILNREDANILSQYNGTNAQTYNLYGRRAADTDYERLAFFFDVGNDVFQIRTEKGSTGSSANKGLVFGTVGIRRWLINTDGHLLAQGAFNIGDGAGNSPVNIWAETSVVSPLVLAGAGATQMSSGVFTGRVSDGFNIVMALVSGGATFQFLNNAGAYTVGRLEGSPVTINLFSGNGITLGGHTIFGTDNTFDVGAAGATRPRNIYAGTKIFAPAYNVAGADGVDFGPGAVTSITVVKGIVTAIS